MNVRMDCIGCIVWNDKPIDIAQYRQASLCHLFKIVNELNDFPGAPDQLLLKPCQYQHLESTLSKFKFSKDLTQCKANCYNHSPFASLAARGNIK